MSCVYAMYLIDTSIPGVFLFQRNIIIPLAATQLSSPVFNSVGHLQRFIIFKGIVFWEQALAVIPFFKGVELIRNSSCGPSFFQIYYAFAE